MIIDETDSAPDAEDRRQLLERMVTEQPNRLPRKMRGAGYPSSEADDLAQETLLRAVRSLEGVRGPADESLMCGWDDRIATNLVHNHRRNASRRPATDPIEATETRRSVGDADLADGITCRATLQSLVAVLPAEQRAVFIARILQEHSTKQVALDLGIPEDLVRWRLRRARERLRTQIDTVA